MTIQQTLEEIMDCALESIERDFRRYESRFLNIMKGIEDTHSEDLIKPYMDKYYEMKRRVK